MTLQMFTLLPKSDVDDLVMAAQFQVTMFDKFAVDDGDDDLDAEAQRRNSHGAPGQQVRPLSSVAPAVRLHGRLPCRWRGR